jgi:hypothetical protein
VRSANVTWASALLACLVGCAPSPEPRAAFQQHIEGRRICGWDEATTSVGVGPSSRKKVAPGTRIAILNVTEDARVADLRAAIAPAEDSLVRLKLIIEGEALLPMTVPHRPEAPPPPEESESTIVGYQKITRPKAAPRDRLADLRLESDRVTVFVENDKPSGRQMAPHALAAHLRGVEPPVTVFTLGASDDTPWPAMREVLVAAACYDRGPGEEPHEVLIR